MIRLIIVLLLFVAIKLAMYCGEDISTTEGKPKQILYEVSSKFNGKVKFKWQTCGKSVPTSKYLPIRAGTSTGNTRFEVVRLSRYGWITGKHTSKYKLQNYKMLLYAYVASQSTLFEVTVGIIKSAYPYLKYPKNKTMFIQLNRKIRSIEIDKSKCVINSADGCKFKIQKINDEH